MKPTIVKIHRILVATLAILALDPCAAATFTSSTTAPVVNGDDIANLGSSTGSDKWWPGTSTAYGNPGMTVGQTFATGNGALLLKAATFRVNSATQPTKNYTIRVGTVAGSTFTTVATETSTQSVATATNAYWTWTFATPVLLSPNTIYGVDVGIHSSTSSYTTGIPYVYFTSAATFPGGSRFRSGSAGDGVGNASISQTSGDRIFHLDLEKPISSTFELVATSPADGETDVLASRNLVLTFSQNISPGSGNLTIRNLTHTTESTIPANDPRLSYDENVLTVDASGLLGWNRNHAVRIDAGAILGAGAVPFAGIDDDTTWNFSTAAGDPLLSAIAELKAHIQGSINLSASQIAAHKTSIDNLRDRFAESAGTISAVFDLVNTYDTVKGPLWVARGEFGDRDTQPIDLDWTIYHVMQYIMDVIYTAPVLAAHESTLNGFKFGSHMNFPGPCPPPANPAQSHSVQINASFNNTFGRDTQQWTLPARKPTGTYLAPGTIATVTVPPEIINKGYLIRVGAQSWDLSTRPPVRRLDRATRVYPIHATTVKVASPYGGGIYIEVPKGANAGAVGVTVTGAVRAPYFSAKSFHQTTSAEWLVERAHPAPWADFQSEKFMMQVPSKWIYNHPNATQLMADWDAAMDAINDLMGFPTDRGKETMYCQVDVTMRSSVHAPGYPAVNVTGNPNTDTYGGYRNHYLIRGPGASPSAAHIEFHEQGHAYGFPKFGGETESNVNLLQPAMLHRKFGYSLDVAQAGSLGSNSESRTLDNTAVAWMCVFNFSPREVAMAEAEKAYQHKGHAKFLDIARLYGWQGLDTYWRSFMEDDANNRTYSTNTDALLLRLSRSVGKDLRPLFHFWGIVPQNNTTLSAALAAENIQADPAIRNLLLHYKTLVPANNAAFRTFAQAWWGKQPSMSGAWEEREHARQWDTAALYGAGDQQRTDATNPGEIYNENSASDIRNRVDELVGLYFPSGITPNPMGFAAAPTPIDASTIGMTATIATAPVGPVEYRFENTTTGTIRDWETNHTWNQSSLTPGQTYSFRVRARNGIGEETLWSPALDATLAPTSTPYELWSDNFTALTDTNPSLDIDKGGLATGIEWFLGGNPTSGSDDSGLAPSLDTTSDSNGKLLFTYRRSATARNDANTNITVEYGSGLGSWTAAAHQGTGANQITITEESNGFGPGIDRVTVALPPDIAASSKLFVRLRVAVANP